MIKNNSVERDWKLLLQFREADLAMEKEAIRIKAEEVLNHLNTMQHIVAKYNNGTTTGCGGNNYEKNFREYK